MSTPIHDYAMIGNCRSAALVARDGSLDWLCLPTFADGACFAGLLGTADDGQWSLCPVGQFSVSRQYRGQTMVLETQYTLPDGSVAIVTDFMPRPSDIFRERPGADVVRIVRGIKGTVRFRSEAIVRFDYGRSLPHISTHDPRAVVALAGPDAVVLRAPVPQQTDGRGIFVEFEVGAGKPALAFSLTWFRSYRQPPEPIDALEEEKNTARFWMDFAARCRDDHPYHSAVVRSMLTLKAMVFEPTGGIVAAPTCSLPERMGGTRNWDYRYCWIRDATITLYALVSTGYDAEAEAWRKWLLRAAAGRPDHLQILYGIRGERRLPEFEANWLDGYGGSKPVHIGNAASTQFQLDIYGEIMAAMHLMRRHTGQMDDPHAWQLQREVMNYVAENWQRPDKSLWEMRGPPRQFTQSKVMAWMAADRCIQAVEQFGLNGPVDEWRKVRQDIFEQVSRKGFHKRRNTFVQYYGASKLDAALLTLPQTGFIRARDPRFAGTVAAVEKYLMNHAGFLRRFDHHPKVDGMEEPENPFLPCGFWLASAYQLMGRKEQAHELFHKLLAVRNDLGLLSEEYDSGKQRLMGNFPQAFSHVTLVATANLLAEQPGAEDPMSARVTDQGDA